MMRRNAFVLSTLFSLSLFALSGCAPSRPALPANSATPSDSNTSAPNALFKDVAKEAGLKFQHQLGDTGQFYFFEFTAPGCALFDFDNDGYLDVFLVQSGSSAPAETVHDRPFCALYHNNRDGTFTDVTLGSGFDKDLGYAQGVAAGDFDNDGYEDIFLTSFGGNHLFRNRGKGKFQDVTGVSGMAKVHGTGYSTSAAWGDYDSDGRLDLYVCYYAEWSHAKDKKCPEKESGLPDYCHPQLYEPMTHRLYHNTGKGFVDVSEKSGITRSKGRGLAVAWIDFNNDFRPDIFVANDVTPAMLWRNDGQGKFTNVADQTGCAYDGEGRGIAGMGVAVADYDHAGQQSLYVTNFSARPNILFKNQGTVFEDVTAQARLAFLHLKFLSFGCEFFDYDADGWSDIIVNNGHVQVRKANREPDVELLQRKQLLHNIKGKFEEISDPALLGELATPTRGRGLAKGDFDNDGHVDILCVNQNGPVQLFRNLTHKGNHWISFSTIGTKSNRDGIGARIEIMTNGVRQIATVQSGSSYMSSSDRRVYFGVGAASKVDEVTVRWPGGQREILKNLPADRFYTLTEGRGVTDKRNPTENHAP